MKPDNTNNYNIIQILYFSTFSFFRINILIPQGKGGAVGRVPGKLKGKEKSLFLPSGFNWHRLASFIYCILMADTMNMDIGKIIK